MTSERTVSVAMATYNGEKYLAEQLKSIADQDHLPSELVACDDGSTDRSLEILKDFSADAPFPVRIYTNEMNLGFSDNFLKSASLCKSELIAFSDQDDVWLPNKLKDALAAIDQVPDTLLVLQNANICNHQLEVSGRIFPGSIRPGRYGRLAQFGFWVWPGCLQTFRASLLREMTSTDRPRSYFPGHRIITHDKLTCLLANALGGIVVLDAPAALYRRHDAALTGSYSQQSVGQRVAKARGVSGDHYDFLADVAKECADYMQNLAGRTDNAAWASAFRDNSQEFRHLSEIQRQRGRLYAAPRLCERLSASLKIARDGGYMGQPFHAMGLRSAAKDIARVVMGSHL